MPAIPVVDGPDMRLVRWSLGRPSPPVSAALDTSTDDVSWTASGGVPENATQINGGLFTAAVYGPNEWVGGSLFESR